MSQITFTNEIAEPPRRPVFRSMVRGFLGRCPNCGDGKLFDRFVKPVHSCAGCGEEMHHQRADDLPPYLNILVVGHLVVGAFTLTEVMTDLSGWVHIAIWGPVILALSLLLMQPLKGLVIGLQWANRMHGFGGEDDLPESHPELHSASTTDERS
jgi:uncharacterized protein (DUF983 family)